MDYESSPSAKVCGSNLRPGSLSERIQNGLPVLIASRSLYCWNRPGEDDDSERAETRSPNLALPCICFLLILNVIVSILVHELPALLLFEPYL
jgi:hypothetical protein